jgi:prepilin-type N-terminal cleavage/methylation domain-containing protein
MRNKSKFFSKGFTLIEILVTIAVMIIMFTVGYYSLNSPKSESKLKAAQREVASAISAAHSNALQGKTVNKTFNKTLPKYWGFYIHNDNRTYEIVSTDTPGSGETAAETKSLGNGVIISVKSGIVNDRIYFNVPHGEMFKGSGSQYSPEESIVITLKLETSTKNISLSSMGAVTEDP